MPKIGGKEKPGNRAGNIFWNKEFVAESIGRRVSLSGTSLLRKFNKVKIVSGTRRQAGKSEVDKLYLEYLVRGQFPEIISWDDLVKIRSYLANSILEKIVLVDLPKVFEVQSPQNLLQLFQVISQESGSLVEYQGLGSALGLSRQTVADYVDYLGSVG